MTTKEFFIKGKKVGWLDDEHIFRKFVNSKKHRLRVMDAYGIEKSIIDELATLGAKEIRIKEEDTYQIYAIEFSEFQRLAVERNLDTPQMFLPVKYFNKLQCR